MYDMLSKNLRGGLSFASQRYAEASCYKDEQTSRENSDFTPNEEREILIDIDANK